MTITYNELTLLGPKCPRVVVVPGWSGFNAATIRIILVPSVCGSRPVMDYLPNTLQTVQSKPPDEISPDGQKAGSGRDQDIVWNQVRNWRGQRRCDAGSITIIGRRFVDGGMSDRLIEIDIVPAGSISGVLVER